MKTQEYTLALLMQARIPQLIWGEPGTGKTAAAVALAKSAGLPIEVVVASLREPADFLGVPVPSTDEKGRTVTHCAPPDWALRLADAERGILFLDEISCAPPAVQAALLRVVQERHVGDVQLPDGIAIVAAANPADQAAGGWDLAPPQANRWVHIDWHLDPHVWADGLENGWDSPDGGPVLPENWESGLPAARSLVASFIRRRPSLLQVLPKEETARGRAWPSGRTWDAVSRILAACTAAGAPGEVQAVAVQGAVGEAAGGEFLTWLSELDLPDPEKLLADPAAYTPIQRGDRAQATLGALVAAVRSKPARGRWEAAWSIVQVHAGHDRGVAAPAAGALIRALKSFGGDVPGNPPDNIEKWADIIGAAKGR